ncbi:uncharacterized protein LOC125190821 isoform X1 [Salvia hispanica]|uniref:uncharacterized protein LOC125190821 isoform X1 n=1 Tax=Salvia hispanica TaxID=49212 RepID=UPI0020099EF2|nr:uncharacterized protein LOC125190821 isoform X1 [Salvia hispanica]
MTDPDEPPKRLQQSLSKDDGSESDWDSDFVWDSCPDPACDPGWGNFFASTPVKVGEEEDDEEQKKLPDEVKNSEDYKKYLQLITENFMFVLQGYDCGSFDFPHFDLKITQATQQLIDRNSVYVEPALQDYNKQHNRKLVFDSV